jgi:1-acyl-sn-glycerol-3-phosphate acyltransferase
MLKLYARLAIKIYCPHMVVNKPHILQSKGPLLLAANHPNSFLDGMILTTLFQQPIYALARGDAFKNKYISKILHWLKQLPVYRTREGAENLTNNYITFIVCRKVLKKDGLVLIFSEAASTNEWHLRLLKKGTARLAISSWQEGIDMPVLPVGLNYSSFKKFGKVVHIYFGEPIFSHQVLSEETDGKQLLKFNALLKTELQKYVYEIKPGDQQTVLKKFGVKTAALTIVLLILPAIIGFITHLPLYYAVKLVTLLFFKDSDHFDSVLHALLVLLYPAYLILIVMVLMSIYSVLAILSFFILPFCAWAFMQVKTKIAYPKN